MLLVMVLFFLSISKISAQQKLTGIVVDEVSKKPIPNVSILIKNHQNLNLINFTTTDDFGNYAIDLQKDLDSIRIETSIISHLSKDQLVVFDKLQDKYVINFNLEERLTELPEVYIEGEKKPITIKKDTTVYDIVQFKDGSERVVEDLLKKLPGITVSDNGSLKFKGKQVTRVLLDNDNIFDVNYTIGTKNINSEIVESVQAIEDYNSNPLLKGIKSSDDVAVNLTLKKGITDVSGNAELGLGFEDKKLLKANLISVSKKLKGFSTISYNNTGENFSPYNFLSNNFEMSQVNELAQRTENLVKANDFNSNLPDARISLNSNYFGSINALYKVDEKLSFRVNYNLFKDKLNRSESYSTFYDFENEQLTISNKKNTVKSPLINTFEYELIYKFNKKSLFTAVGKWDTQSVKESSVGLNNNSDFKSFTKSKDLFLNSNMEYTYRINDKNVFQISGIVSSNGIPQNVDVLRDNESINQTIDFKKNYLKLQSSLLSKKGKNEFAFDLGYNFTENYVDSDLLGMTMANVFLTNNIYLRSSKIYANASHKFGINKWSFSTQFNSNLYDITLNDVNLQSGYDNSFINFTPKFTVRYYVNKVSHIYADYSLTNQLPNANTIYSGLILTNHRSLSNNEFSFNLFNNHTSTFGYRINDFYNLFRFNFYGSYHFKKHGYVNKLNIDEENSFYTSIVDVTDNGSLNFGLDLEKYIHLLRSTININSSYSVDEYQNIVNDSELRNNLSKSWFGNFSIRTGFKGKINFENKAFLRNFSFENEGSKSNSFTTFQNDFNIKFISKEFQFIVNNQYFKPDLSNETSGDLFLDLTLRYQPKKGKIEYQIKADNLLNNNIYRNINTSDFSTSIFQLSLQNRFILFSVQFKF